ncbi:MAG: ABC transporter ATP-binding protein [Bacteroidales bacterium]|nr:ABC transporter ATP-binding protein [Bacteroidales bacterium]
MKNVFRVFKYILNYKKDIVLNVLSNLIYVFFSLFSFVMIIPFISVLFGVIDSPAQCPELSLDKDVLMDYLAWNLNIYKDIYGIYPCLIAIGVVYIICIFFSAFFRYLGMYFIVPIRNGLVNDLRNDVYKKICILPISFFSDKKKGDIMSRLTSDLADIEWSVVSSLQMLVKDSIMVIVFFSALILASWQLVLFIVIVLPLAYFLIKKIGNSLKRNSIKGQKEMGVLLSQCEETLGGLRAIKSYGAEGVTKEKFKQSNDYYTKVMTKIFRRKELASPLTEFLAIFVLVAVVLFGGELVLVGKMSAAILIGFTLIFAKVISPLQELSTAYYNMQKGDAAAIRIYEILDAEEKITECENPKQVSEFKDSIEFRNVFFSYDNSKENVLKDISFTVKKGQTVALVGESGAGKSTLIDLISRFADVTSGEILFDGVNIKELSINSLRDKVGIVTQEAILFNDTIFKNIAFGNPSATMEEVIAAAKIANADSFISKMEKGYYTHLSDRGMSLSGGERQRLCIARAILKNPEILLLDEATSALDTQNEHEVQQALNTLMKDRTSVVIAHRLTTIMNADKILVMDKGVIVESGTHKELLEKGGIYSNLVNMQSLNA